MSPEPTAPGTAASLVGPFLGTQLTVLLAADDALRERDESVVHAGRVATRRSRSALRVFSPLFASPAGEELDRELRWWASILGPVRDLQVLQDRLDGLVAELDEELVVGPVRTRIDVELGRDRLQHWSAVVEALGSERHRELVGQLRRWQAETPWTAKATRPDSTLRDLLQDADRVVAERLARARRSGDVEDMHSARKAAKRARYAAEVIAPVSGPKALRTVDRYRRLQDLLGELQDSTVSAQLLRRLADTADKEQGESSFTFGLLHEREQRRARETAVEAQRLAKRLYT